MNNVQHLETLLKLTYQVVGFAQDAESEWKTINVVHVARNLSAD